MVQLQGFKNLVDLLEYFRDEQVCRDYLEAIRWDGVLECPYAECSSNNIYKFKDGKRYKCADCQRTYSVKVGSIFEDSKISLRKWYAAVYLITAHKKGISSCQLARDLGVTQKTAWYMNHRVRHSLGMETDVKLQGNVEADETFIGGLEANKHASKRTKNAQGRSVKTKTPVAGVVERGGRLIAMQVPDTSGANLRRFVVDNVKKGSQLNTDEWFGYNGLEKLYSHQIIKHNDKQYVQGDCHTNTMEGYWSLLKRGIVGIYHSVSSKHLQKYLDEFSYRYNTRKFSENERFINMLTNISTTLPYSKLISDGKQETKPFNPVATNIQMEFKQGNLGF